MWGAGRRLPAPMREVIVSGAKTEDGPLTLAIPRIGGFRPMLHPQDEIREQLADQRPGIGIHVWTVYQDMSGGQWS